MDNIYQTAIRAVESGAKFNIDFESRSLKLDGKYLIKNGEYEGELGIAPCDDTEFRMNVEKLYNRYRHSVPSERSESKSRRYFTALSAKEIADEDMMYGERRDKAQVELELYVLCNILNGLQWNSDTMGKWFWRSKEHKDLVMLKSWVEPD